MNSKTAVRKRVFGVAVGRRPRRGDRGRDQVGGQPRWLTRSITFCANANAGWPVGTSSIDELRGLLSGLALFPLRQLVVQRNRLARKHGRHPVAELAHQRIGDVVDGERMLRARPRRCGRETAPAATRRRVPRAARRRCRRAPRRTARRSPRAGTGAASRGSARSPTARRCAACPSSRPRRPAARPRCGVRRRNQLVTGGQSRLHRRMVGVRRQQHRCVLARRRPGAPPAATTAP